ncbi:flavodoxin family protein [Psychrobacter sp. I-STPA6b]|uniref:flavodoxin family protein n=1 Tax=Psychrobacter sp. I-STPA6b TaxID=2585718 RepID=UPI001D0C4860|nr:flavodoxin family protein [Psychrobacter sp. I-STPA6b]
MLNDVESGKLLLFIYHAPSKNTQYLCQAVVDSIKEASIRIKVLSVECVQPQDVLEADAVLLGTLENLSYLSGMTKDFFDRCYYPLLEKKQGLAFAAYVRAGHDGTGSVRALETITTGLRWRWVQPALVLKGSWQDSFVTEAKELALSVAVGLECGMY